MKKLQIVITILCISVICCSCSITMKAYPVSGPIAESGEIYVFKAKVNNVAFGNSGTIKMIGHNSEYFEGQWSSLAGERRSRNNPESNLNDETLIGRYGSEFGLVPRGNENRGYAMMVGDKGTLIEIEYLNGAGTAHGFGIGKDNHGNIFKILF